MAEVGGTRSQDGDRAGESSAAEGEPSAAGGRRAVRAQNSAARSGRPARSMRAGAAMVGLGAAIVLIDQLVKTWALSALDDAPIRVIGDFFRLLLVFNSGAAFSMGENATPVFSILATVVVLGLLWFATRVRNAWWALGLGLILGGAAGNLGDRIFRAPSVLHGHVVDYLSFGSFPVFNIADASLTVGVVVIALAVLLGQDPYPLRDGEAPAEADDADEGPKR